MACIPVFAQSAADMALGEVRKIDKEARKITIKHGEIKELEMPPMTMVFTLKDPGVLENFKVGDKVKFKVVREDGKMLVTEMLSQ
ncbi:MAG: copper-binding protein [Sulfuritalea sp.]|nr:copper-binding protein [Sulfuritalea sp.]